MQFANNITTFLVGVLGHRTTVYHANIGRIIHSDALKTALLKEASKGLALRKIELTAQCMETYTTFHSGVFDQFYRAKL